jgi:hypothetical protein
MNEHQRVYRLVPLRDSTAKQIISPMRYNTLVKAVKNSLKYIAHHDGCNFMTGDCTCGASQCLSYLEALTADDHV